MFSSVLQMVVKHFGQKPTPSPPFGPSAFVSLRRKGQREGDDLFGMCNPGFHPGLLSLAPPGLQMVALCAEGGNKIVNRLTSDGGCRATLPAAGPHGVDGAHGVTRPTIQVPHAAIFFRKCSRSANADWKFLRFGLW
jgi:hypothetical protein